MNTTLDRPLILATVALLSVVVMVLPPAAARAQGTDPFDTTAIRDEGTLDVVVLEDWHVDTVNGTTRQKLIEIKVAEWWPGQDYRIPVRMIVPLTGKATGFHITGAHPITSLEEDVELDGLDALLIAGGVGVVHTVVRPLASLPGGAVLEEEMLDHSLDTLDPRYTTQWIWAMTLMRAVTAAYAETGYFDPGKVAGSGDSKNGTAPALALINDDRFTAIRSGVASSSYASPLRLLDQGAIDAVNAANDWFFTALTAGEINPGDHTEQWYRSNAWGTSGHGDYTLVLAAGWTWEDLRALNAEMAPYYFLSENWDELMARAADVLLEPGTHDWVAYDILWGAQNYPDIPVYYLANGGHNQSPHPAAETDTQNEVALFLKHFLGGTDPMLEPPSSSYEIIDHELHVSVTFDSGPEAESGRIWWIYDRHQHPGGSAGFLWERIPDDQWMDMTFDGGTGAWTAVIPLELNHFTVDFFSNHGLVVDGRQTYLSSPYTRAGLEDILPVSSLVGWLVLPSALTLATGWALWRRRRFG